MKGSQKEDKRHSKLDHSKHGKTAAGDKAPFSRLHPKTVCF